jgi:succinate-acetate transporter protein
MAFPEQRAALDARELVVADPTPLGLAAFALPLFLLGGYLADFVPNWVWIGPGVFLGGLVQILAGLWAFRNRDVLAATAFSIYGGFWLTFLYVGVGGYGGGRANVANGLAWLLIGLTFFTSYLLLASMRYGAGLFGFFLGLELTQILLVICLFVAAHREISLGSSGFVSDDGWTKLAGWLAIVTAAVAWLTSAAGVAVGTGGPAWLAPLGRPLSWSRPTRPK